MELTSWYTVLGDFSFTVFWTSKRTHLVQRLIIVAWWSTVFRKFELRSRSREFEFGRFTSKVKVKVNVDLYSASSWTHFQVWYAFSGDLTVLPVQCTPRVHPLTEWTIPVFAFPAEAGTYLPTPEGWKAELALGGWLVTYWNRYPAPGIEPDTVTHLSTNRVRRRLTSLIKASVLTTTPDYQTN